MWQPKNITLLKQSLILQFIYPFHDLSGLVTKPTKWLCTQRRLRSAWASAQSDQSSLCAQWVAKDPSFLCADSDPSIRLGGCPGWSESSLGAHAILLVLSRGGSFMKNVSIHYVCVTDIELFIDIVLQQLKVGSTVCEPRHDKICLREFPTRPDPNWPAQPQKLARVLKFRL